MCIKRKVLFKGNLEFPEVCLCLGVGNVTTNDCVVLENIYTPPTEGVLV